MEGRGYFGGWVPLVHAQTSSMSRYSTHASDIVVLHCGDCRSSCYAWSKRRDKSWYLVLTGSNFMFCEQGPVNLLSCKYPPSPFEGQFIWQACLELQWQGQGSKHLFMYSSLGIGYSQVVHEVRQAPDYGLAHPNKSIDLWGLYNGRFFNPYLLFYMSSHA